MPNKYHDYHQVFSVTQWSKELQQIIHVQLLYVYFTLRHFKIMHCKKHEGYAFEPNAWYCLGLSESLIPPLMVERW